MSFFFRRKCRIFVHFFQWILVECAGSAEDFLYFLKDRPGVNVVRDSPSHRRGSPERFRGQVCNRCVAALPPLRGLPPPPRAAGSRPDGRSMPPAPAAATRVRAGALPQRGGVPVRRGAVAAPQERAARHLRPPARARQQLWTCWSCLVGWHCPAFHSGGG